MGKKVLTIGRQYGSNGRKIAKALSERLGIHYYDRELIQLVSERSELPYELLAEADEQKSGFWQSPVSDDIQLERRLRFEPIDEKMYQEQTEIIRELAEKEDCIIVGRCSNYILRDFPGSRSIFVYAPMKERTAIVSERTGLDAKNARNLIKKMDKQRSYYYNYHTDRTWDDMLEYSMCVDSSKYTMEQMLDILETYYKSI